MNTQPTAELIKKQENVVKTLEKEVDELRANAMKNAMNTKVGRFTYRTFRVLRGLGLTTVVLGGTVVQAAILGDTAVIVFNIEEDMETLRDQYIQDIEEVVSIAAEASS